MSEHDAHAALTANAAERRALIERDARERRKQETVGARKPLRETTYETKVEEYYK